MYGYLCKATGDLGRRLKTRKLPRFLDSTFLASSMTTELKLPHPVISMSHMNIKSLTFSPLIVSTSKNETKIILAVAKLWKQFSSKGRYHFTLKILWQVIHTSGFLQSLFILLRLICIISVYFWTVLLQNKKMIQILITWTPKVSEAICLNNWWHCSRVARLTLEPGCVPDQTWPDIEVTRVPPGLWLSIQTKWIVE